MSEANVDRAALEEAFRTSLTNSIESDKWCRTVLLRNANNFWPLVEVLRDREADGIFQVYAVDHMLELVNAHHSILPVSAALDCLLGLDDSCLRHDLVVSKVGSVIGCLSRVIYQRLDDPNGVRFFPLKVENESGVCSRLLWRGLCGSVEAMSSDRRDCSSEDNLSVLTSFEDDHIPWICAHAFRGLEHNPEEAVRLLLCLFRYRERCQQNPCLVNPFLEEEVYNHLRGLALEKGPPGSVDAVTLIEVLARSSEARPLLLNPALPQFRICRHIQCFVGCLIESRNFFAENGNRGAFLRLFDGLYKKVFELDPTFTKRVIQFLVNVLEQDFELSLSLFPVVCSRVCDSLSLNPSPFQEDLSCLLQAFVGRCVSAIKHDPVGSRDSLLCTPCPFSDPVLKLLLVLGPGPVERTSRDLLNEASCYASVETFSEEKNVIFGFIFMIFRQILKRECRSRHGSCPSIFDIIRCVIDVMGSVSGDILSGSSEGGEGCREVVFEQFGLLFLKSLVRFCYGQGPSHLQSFLSDDIGMFVFHRCWDDAKSGLCASESLRSLDRFMKCDRAVGILERSGYSETFLESYSSLPCKTLLYLIGVRLVTRCSNSSVIESSKRLCLSLHSEFGGRNDESSMRKLFKILTCLFRCSLDWDCHEWKKIYRFFFSGFSSIIVGCAQSPFRDILVNFVHQLIYSLPSSDPFRSVCPDSMRLFKFYIFILGELLSGVCEVLSCLPVNDAIFEGAFTVTDFDCEQISLKSTHSGDLYLGHLKMKANHDLCFIKKSERGSLDYGWSILSIIVSCVNDLLESPFPNFGLLEFYNDTCVFDLVRSIGSCLDKTSLVSITTRPDLFEGLVSLCVKLCRYFRGPVLFGPCFEFVSRIVSVTFISHEQEIVKKGCICLRYLLIGDSSDCDLSAAQASVLRRHFVLALNVVMQSFTCWEASEFVHYFAKIDRSFTVSVGDLIKRGLESEEQRISFDEALSHIWDEDPADEGDECDPPKTRFDHDHFKDHVERLSIHLHDVPTLRDFFDIQRLGESIPV